MSYFCFLREGIGWVVKIANIQNLRLFLLLSYTQPFIFALCCSISECTQPHLLVSQLTVGFISCTPNLVYM